VRFIAITKPTVSGTEAADASAAASALRGGLGIITVKLDIHTATHDRPTNVEFAARARIQELGGGNSEASHHLEDQPQHE